MITGPINLGCGSDYLRKIIITFKAVDFDSPDACSVEPFRSPSVILSRQSWAEVRNHFSIDETVILAQALTILEREFEWPGGPGATAIWILKDLSDRQVKVGELLADWIARRTRNGYLKLACDRRPGVRTWAGDLSYCR